MIYVDCHKPLHEPMLLVNKRAVMTLSTMSTSQKPLLGQLLQPFEIPFSAETGTTLTHTKGALKIMQVSKSANVPNVARESEPVQESFPTNKGAKFQVSVHTSGTKCNDDDDNVKVCDICGDSGFEEMLAICSECGESAEHMYCMQTLMEAMPENNWLCECCKLKKEDRRQDILSASPSPSFKNDEEILGTRLDNSKVISNPKVANRGHATSVTPAKRTMCDLPNASNKIPKIGIGGTIQRSVSFSGHRRVIGRENASGKVKFLSTSPVTKSMSRSSSEKLSKAVNTFSKRTLLMPLEATAGKCDFPFNSTVDKRNEVPPQSARRALGATSVSCAAATSVSGLLQSRSGIPVLSKKSYEKLPTFLISSKPPNVLKGQVSSKCHKDIFEGERSTQMRATLLAKPYPTDPENSSTQNSSPKGKVEACTDSPMNETGTGSGNAIQVPEQKPEPVTSPPVDSGKFDQEMYREEKMKQIPCTSLQPTDELPLHHSKDVTDAADCSTSELSAAQNIPNISTGKLVDIPACLHTSFTENEYKEKATTLQHDTAIVGAKSCVGWSQTNDVLNQRVKDRDVASSLTEEAAVFEKSDCMEVIANDSYKVLDSPCIDTSEIQDVNVESKQLNIVSDPSCCSGFVPSLVQIRCYKCKEVGHRAWNCQSRSGVYALNPPVSQSGASPDVAYTIKIPAIINRVALSESNTKFSEHKEVISVGEGVSTQATTSGDMLINLESHQVPAVERNHSALILEPTNQCDSSFDIRRRDVAPEANTLDNVSSCPSIDKSGLLEETSDQARTSLSAICKQSFYSFSELGNPHHFVNEKTLPFAAGDKSLETFQPVSGVQASQSTTVVIPKPRKQLQHSESNDFGSPTAGNNQEIVSQSLDAQSCHFNSQIAVSETMSTRVHIADCSSKLPQSVSIQLPSQMQSHWSEFSIAGKYLSEKGNVSNSDVRALRVRKVPSPGCAASPLMLSRVFAEPESDFIWRGGFRVVANGRLPIVYDGIEAHASSKAVNKVHEAARALPSVLQLEAVQRGEATASWPKPFVMKPPSDESIALYFFPINESSFHRFYRPLLDHMIMHDLALKGRTDAGAELLAFPSNLLPENFQRSWHGKMFLWGVFRGKKASKVDESSSTRCLGLPNGGGSQTSNNLPSLRPYTGTVSIDNTFPACTTVTSNVEVLDMEVDMEGGKEVGVIDLPVRKSVDSNAEHAGSGISLHSVVPENPQPQETGKVCLEHKVISCEEVPAPRVPMEKHEEVLTLRVATENPLSQSSPHSTHDSHENDYESAVDDLPPGFGLSTNAPEIIPDLPPGFDNCNKILNKENNLSNLSGHNSPRSPEGRLSRPSLAAVQQSHPLVGSPKEKPHEESLVGSHSYRHRNSSFVPDLPGQHKRRFEQERIAERDRDNCGEPLHHRDSKIRFLHRSESSVRNEKERERYQYKHSEARYGKHDYNRMHRKEYRNYSSKEKGSSKILRCSRGHIKSSSHSRSRSPSRGCSPRRRRAPSHSPHCRCVRRSGGHSSPHRSRLTSSSDSDRGRRSLESHGSKVKQGEFMGIQKGVPAYGKRGLGRVSRSKASDSAEGSLVENHDCTKIEEKNAVGKECFISEGANLMEACDSSQEGLAMADSVNEEVTRSSENERLLKPTKVIRYKSFIKEEASQDITAASEVCSAAEQSFLSCSARVVPALNMSNQVQSGSGEETMQNCLQLLHSPTTNALSSNTLQTELCEDVRTSISPALKLAMSSGEASPFLQPLFLLKEQVGLMGSKFDCTTLKKDTATVTTFSSREGEKLKLDGDCGNELRSLDLAFTVSEERRGALQIFHRDERGGFLQPKDVDISLRL